MLDDSFCFVFVQNISQRCHGTQTVLWFGGGATVHAHAVHACGCSLFNMSSCYGKYNLRARLM